MRQIVVLIALLLVTGGCANYRQYSRPDGIETGNLFGDDVASDSDTVSVASIPWREFFTDTRLQALIDTALAYNSDLRIASLRVAQAEATLSAARLAYLPAVSLNPQGGISSYAVATQLVATVANSYYNLLALDRQLEISRLSLESWDEIIRTLRVRKDVGEAHEASVAQAVASRLDVENTILSLSRQIKALTTSHLGCHSGCLKTVRMYDRLSMPFKRLSIRSMWHARPFIPRSLWAVPSDGPTTAGLPL